MVDGGYEHGLESGFLDLVIGNWRTPPEHLHLLPLCKDKLVCLTRNGRPIKPGQKRNIEVAHDLHERMRLTRGHPECNCGVKRGSVGISAE